MNDKLVESTKDTEQSVTDAQLLHRLSQAEHRDRELANELDAHGWRRDAEQVRRRADRWRAQAARIGAK